MQDQEVKYDVIVVLARGINLDGSLPSDPKRRVEKGVELYKKGLANKIIMSGSWTFRMEESPARTEAEAMKAYAIELGVAPDDVLREEKSKDTMGNAYFVKTLYLKDRNWKKVIVVTGEDHLERSKYLFDRILGDGYTIEYVATDPMLDEEAFLKSKDRERRVIVLTEKLMNQFHVRPGNDEDMFRFMATHLGYAKNPTITLEQFDEMLSQIK